MKRFLIKFCAFFSLIWGFIGYYVFAFSPQLSGDMGEIGKIAFGQKYMNSIKEPFALLESRVNTIEGTDTITSQIITIGDSFSQSGKFGFSQFIAMESNCSICNIARTNYTPEQEFIVLANNHLISPKTIVIIESVERSFIGRLNGLDFQETKMSNPLPKKENKLDALNETIVWIRNSLGMKQPIITFHTEKDLFSHETRHNELYIYSSKWARDGDLLFKDISAKAIEEAYNNLYRLHEFAQLHGIKLIYLVAADKYDVYEPFIIEEHIKNPTLDNIPSEEWIINSKPLLQNAINAGTRDVYYLNDTHWSPIGSKIVGEEVARRISELREASFISSK